MLKKVGVYIGPAASDNKLKWARSASVVKAFNDAGVLDYAKPGAITIYRKYFDDQNVWVSGIDRAYSIISDLTGLSVDTLKAIPLSELKNIPGRRPKYVEILNECNQFLWDNLPRYIQMHKEAVPVLHAYGVGALLGNWSTQQPPDQEWLYIQSENFGDCDRIAIHEYWTGDQNGARFNQDSALKHQHVHELLKGKHPNMIVTECGRDAVEGIAP